MLAHHPGVHLGESSEANPQRNRPTGTVGRLGEGIIRPHGTFVPMETVGNLGEHGP
jgi:hypothetical protein